MHSATSNESGRWVSENHRVLLNPVYCIPHNIYFIRNLLYRLVGDKYIISCHVVCWSADFYALRINVWDLQSVIQAPQEQTTQPLHSFDLTTHSWHDRNVDGVRDTLVDKLRVFIDDYQIRCLITWKYDFERRETPVPMLYFLNFFLS